MEAQYRLIRLSTHLQYGGSMEAQYGSIHFTIRLQYEGSMEIHYRLIHLSAYLQYGGSMEAHFGLIHLSTHLLCGGSMKAYYGPIHFSTHIQYVIKIHDYNFVSTGTKIFLRVSFVKNSDEKILTVRQLCGPLIVDLHYQQYRAHVFYTCIIPSVATTTIPVDPVNGTVYSWS